MLNLRNGTHKDLEKVYQLMEMDFDSEELLPKYTIHKAMMTGTTELLIAYDDESGMDLGYALAFIKGMYNYILLKYIAVFPWYREKGVGVEFMRLINKRYAEKQGIVAEITEFPDDYPNHLVKLFRFFARFGYTEVPSSYKIGGTAAHIYVKPIKGTAEIKPVLHRIIRDFYSRVMSYSAMYAMIDIKKEE